MARIIICRSIVSLSIAVLCACTGMSVPNGSIELPSAKPRAEPERAQPVPWPFESGIMLGAAAGTPGISAESPIAQSPERVDGIGAGSGASLPARPHRIDTKPATASKQTQAPPPSRPTPAVAAEISAKDDEMRIAITQPKLGSSVIRVPSKMKQGSESIARLIVSPEQLASLVHRADDARANDVRDARERVRLTPRMRASLAAPGFAIEPKDAQEQIVKEGEPTEWIWTLVPEVTGARTLVFTLEGLMMVGGKESAIRPPALTVPVEVDVNPIYLIERYWQWLMTAILVPLAGFVGKRWFDRRVAAVTKPV